MSKKVEGRYTVGKITTNSFRNVINMKEDYTGIKVDRRFLNYTGKPIIVVDRTGFHNKIATSYDYDEKDFIIRTIYSFHVSNDITYFKKFFKQYQHKDQKYPFMDLLKKEFDFVLNDIIENNKKNYFSRDFSKATSLDIEDIGNAVIDVSVDVTITREELSKGGIYEAQTDLLIRNFEEDIFYEHPFDDLEYTFNKYTKMAEGFKGLVTFLEIVDKENNIGTQYVNTHNRILAIKPSKCVDKADGVYFGTLNKANTQDDFETKYFTFEDAWKELSIFKTKQDAEENGDKTLLNQQRLADLQIENQRLKIQFEETTTRNKLALEEQKQKFEESQFERNVEISKLKAFIEEKKLKESDYYESRSLQRKDTNEYIKIAGTVIASGLAIWLAIRKSS